MVRLALDVGFKYGYLVLSEAVLVLVLENNRQRSSASSDAIDKKTQGCDIHRGTRHLVATLLLFFDRDLFITVAQIRRANLFALSRGEGADPDVAESDGIAMVLQ